MKNIFNEYNLSSDKCLKKIHIGRDEEMFHSLKYRLKFFYVTPNPHICYSGVEGCSEGKIKHILRRVGRSRFITWFRHEIKINSLNGFEPASLGTGKLNRATLLPRLSIRHLLFNNIAKTLIFLRSHK